GSEIGEMISLQIQEEALESSRRIRIIAAHRAGVIDPAPFGQAGRIVRVTDRRGEGAIEKPGEGERYSVGIQEDAGYVALRVNLLWSRLISGARIIKRAHQL